MIDIIFNTAVLFLNSSIALGVGTSTLAISSFLVALQDGEIDPSERRMLGVIYCVLRIAMLGIIVMSSAVYMLDPKFLVGLDIYLLIIMTVLVLNAIAMTKHWISGKYGPAIQAGTWYTMGFMATIHMFELFAIDTTTFLLFYAGDVLLAYFIVNGFLAYFKRNKV